MLVVEFTPETAELSAAEFAADVLGAIGAEIVVGGEGFRFGRGQEGDCDLLRSLGLDAREVPLVARRLVDAHPRARDGRRNARPRRSCSAARSRSTASSSAATIAAERSASRPRTSGSSPTLLVPAYGIYAGAVGDRRAAVSIGVNPHYGGTERRIEAYLLDWEGDLYGDRLVVELWRRLRDERAFASEAELVAQIARDVEETRAATRP